MNQGITQVDLATVADEYTLFKFMYSQLASRIRTVSLVQVLNCTNAGGITAAGTVDVKILVNLLVADGTTVPHGTLYKVPYSRLQGGKKAIILDPEANDIGIALFCERDISKVKANPTQAIASGGVPPGSWRKFSYSDGLYLPAVLNGVPEDFIAFTPNGIVIQSPNPVTINDTQFLPGGNINCPGTMTAKTDVVAANVSLVNHTHSGVQSGSNDSGPPVAT